MLDQPTRTWLRKTLEARRTAILRENRALSRREDQLERQQHPSHRAHSILLDLNREILALIATRLARLGEHAGHDAAGYAYCSVEELAALTHAAEDAGDDIAFLAIQAEVERRDGADQAAYRTAWIRQTGDRLRRRRRRIGQAA